MRLAPGVDVFTLRPEIIIGLLVVDRVYRSHGLEMVVTSVYRSGTKQSLHGRGLAADIRLPSRCGGTPEQDVHFPLEIIEALGGRKPAGMFDLVHEVGVAGGDHYHLEFDPLQYPVVKQDLA